MDTLNQINDNALWDMWLGRLYLPALAVADELGLFGYISEPKTIVSISKELRTSTEGINALCGLLASLGYITTENNNISLTDLSRKYLLPSSKYYWGASFARTKNSDEYIRVLDAFKNKPGNYHSHGKDLNNLWQNNLLDESTAESFSKIMDCTIITSAKLAIDNNLFSGINNLLDVGGGSGCFSNLFLNKYPTAHATIFELDGVCSYLKKAGFNNNISLHPGNFLTDDLPPGHDAILLSNILHDWNLENVDIILSKCYKALEKNGKIIVNEMLLDEEFANPTSYAFNLLMYVNYGGQQFRDQQLSKILSLTGFTNIEITPLDNYYSIITGYKI